MMDVNLGDLIFQLFTFGSLILAIILIVLFIRSISKRRNQLDSIEKKVDAINERINKNND
ncbi:DUF4083 family protein [Cytobacillus sp. IB215316]|uniref:DUF4083 family protein n=1 Tax=Cytobacillus sp. IB215316 TaxID=3097354 RepID=UPI002A10B254|nr:DUF4083 family protein [Cytobacillus sp. IB215316]MDX8361621.1 DUF4083 family protein [Cytobacillus sp. IB215316]